MSPSKLAIVCPQCDSRATAGPDEIRKTLRRHNERRHNGRPVASVAGDAVDRLRGDRL